VWRWTFGYQIAPNSSFFFLRNEEKLAREIQKNAKRGIATTTAKATTEFPYFTQTEFVQY